jgi:hypothetical protein
MLLISMETLLYILLLRVVILILSIIFSKMAVVQLLKIDGVQQLKKKVANMVEELLIFLRKYVNVIYLKWHERVSIGGSIIISMIN